MKKFLKKMHQKEKKNHMVTIRWFNCEKENFPKWIFKKKIHLMVLGAFNLARKKKNKKIKLKLNLTKLR